MTLYDTDLYKYTSKNFYDARISEFSRKRYKEGIIIIAIVR